MEERTIFHIYNDLARIAEANEQYNLQKKFYHYTSLTGFKIMFENFFRKKDAICLIASNLRYLNDEKEYIEGETYLKHDKNHTIDEKFDIYISCFCGENDLLTQWQCYGKDSGLSIEFNLKAFYCGCPNGEYVYVPPIPVAYETNQRDIYYQAGEDNGAVELIMPICKHPSFSHELESRLIFFPFEQTEYEYREKNGILIPFIKIKIYPQDKEHKAAKEYYKEDYDMSNLIRSITVGPGKNQYLVFNSIIHMIDKNDNKFFSAEDFNELKKNKHHADLQFDSDNMIFYKTKRKIKIKLSNIPFRG